MQVPVLVVRGRRLLCGEAGEEGGVGQVERGRVDPEMLGNRRPDLEYNYFRFNSNKFWDKNVGNISSKKGKILGFQD